MRSRFGVPVLAVVCMGGCTRQEQRAATPAPAPSPRVVYVVVTPPARALPALEPTWTPEPELVSTRAAVLEVPVAQPRPTLDVATIPNMDRPRDPTPRYRNDQLSGCLTYDVEPSPGGQWGRVKVTGRNRCSSSISADEGWFEVTAIGWQGGVQDRQVGRFQQAIAPFSSAETYIEVNCAPGPCRYGAAVWWAAGGGRRAQSP